MDIELLKLQFNQTIEKYHQAMNDLAKGNAAPLAAFFSEQEDVSLADRVGPAVHGHQEVVKLTERAVSSDRENKTISFENLVKVITPDLAFIVETEHYPAKAGEKEGSASNVVRATSIFRMEVGGWKLLHRHADAVISEPTPETMKQG